MPGRGAARIGELDLPDRLSPAVPGIVTQLLAGIVCFMGTLLIRSLVDLYTPGAAPFALVFPAITLATLFARWPAGAITAALSIGQTYFFIYLAQAGRVQPPSWALFAIIVSSLLTILLAETFRRAVRQATRERDREIDNRDLLLAEFEHRVKNNFAIVAAMLDVQRRRTTVPAAAEALTAALLRVESVARAHRHLYRGTGAGDDVQLRAYLEELTATLADALLLKGGVLLTCDADDAAVPRDRAVSIGLIVNELVTNAAKHAFAGRERGTIAVAFKRQPDAAWRLTVADDGIGLPAQPVPVSANAGLGSRLIDGFARQAGGTLSTDSDPMGTRVTLTMPD